MYCLSLETSDPLWIKVALKLGLPTKGVRFEWRYRKNIILHIFKVASFKIISVRCIIYFGRSIYEFSEKYFPFLIKILKIIDDRSDIGRNIMIIGQKAVRAYKVLSPQISR